MGQPMLSSCVFFGEVEGTVRPMGTEPRLETIAYQMFANMRICLWFRRIDSACPFYGRGYPYLLWWCRIFKVNGVLIWLLLFYPNIIWFWLGGIHERRKLSVAIEALPKSACYAQVAARKGLGVCKQIFCCWTRSARSISWRTVQSQSISIHVDRLADYHNVFE